MSLQIELDQTKPYYTNHDDVRGKVVLLLPKSESIGSITVKLEGESRTTFTRRVKRHGVDNSVLEHHKILYEVEELSPIFDESQSDRSSKSSESALAKRKLQAGRHEFPFIFKLPATNSCGTDGKPEGFRMSESHLSLAHVQKQLPPTWTGIPNKAEIEYFIKATVNRPGLLKSAIREKRSFEFRPMEPSRPPPSDTGSFVEKKHDFDPLAHGPSLSAMAQLPSPGILTVSQGLPLHIQLQRLDNGQSETIIRSLSISLIGSTQLRAEGEKCTISQPHILVSRTQLALKVGGAASKELIIDPLFWGDVIVSPNIPPSFRSCNVTQSYELEVDLEVESTASINAKLRKAHLSLRLPVALFSGVSPSASMINTQNAKVTEQLQNPFNTSDLHVLPEYKD